MRALCTGLHTTGLHITGPRMTPTHVYTQYTHIRHFTTNTRVYVGEIDRICTLVALYECDECDEWHYVVKDGDGAVHEAHPDDMMTVQ